MDQAGLNVTILFAPKQKECCAVIVCGQLKPSVKQWGAVKVAQDSQAARVQTGGAAEHR